jgi:hypothetical protein
MIERAPIWLGMVIVLHSRIGEFLCRYQGHVWECYGFDAEGVEERRCMRCGRWEADGEVK